MKLFRGFPVAVALCSMFFGAAMTAPPASASVHSVRPECGTPRVGFAGCFALKVTGGAQVSAFDGPDGYHPADLQSAYKLSGTTGTGQTVGIVDAFDDPNAEADLATYRTEFGLAPCTTSNGCFAKVNQAGGTSYPGANVGWAAEISLDLDMVSAICPNCHILLVEATTNNLIDLAAAENEAAALGATEISNSYGGPEFQGESELANAYRHPGIPITVSTGDSAYVAGAQMPAAFKTVTAVGGTNLSPAPTSRGWKETAWFTNVSEGAGSGCSGFISKPAWQHDTGCAKRTVGDVAAVADPATGVSVYDSYSESGWLVFGGTSVASPIIASVYALAGNGAVIKNASFLYAHTTHLFDVRRGSTGSCGGTYLCTAAAGYDGPTGLGTPHGVKGF